jgi:non-ribosomal peptide synthetase component F
MTEHRNVVGLFFNERFGFDFGASDVMTFFHSYCFDLALWEMYGALLFGAKLVIVPPETSADLQAFLELLKREKVTVVSQTPRSMYSLIELEMQAEHSDLSLRHICLGGEALIPTYLKPLKEKYRL